MNYQTYVITLPEAKGRQSHMRDMLSAQHIDFSFFDAVDGRALDVPSHPIYNNTKRRLFFGRDMTGGEIGVLLSHKAIYEKMVSDEIDLALIFEDDAQIKPNFKMVLDALIQGEKDFDLVRFLGSDKVSKLQQYSKRQVTGDYHLNRLRTTPGGAHAYIITHKGAAKMLRILDRIHLPIDTLMGHTWLNDLDAYIIQPGLATQDLGQDQFIGDARFDKKNNLSGWMRYLFPITRAGFKAYEGLMKNIQYKKCFARDRKMSKKR